MTVAAPKQRRVEQLKRAGVIHIKLRNRIACKTREEDVEITVVIEIAPSY